MRKNRVFPGIASVLLAAMSCVTAPPPATTPAAPDAPAITLLAENGTWIGITVKTLGNVVVINDVYWNSPATVADLRKGDILRAVNGAPVTRPADIAAILQQSPAEIKLTVARFEQSISRRKDEKSTDLSPDDFAKQYAEFLQKGKVGESFDLAAETRLATLEKTLRPSNVPPRARIAAPQPAAERKPPSARAWLGIGFDDVNNMADVGGTAGRKGIKFTRIYENSPAEKAGLKIGDIATAIDGAPFPTGATDSPRVRLVELLQKKRPGDSVTFEIFREIAAVTVDNTSTEIPADKVPTVIREMPEGKAIRAVVQKKAEIRPLTVTLGAGPESPAAAPLNIEAIHPELAQYQSDEERLARKLMAATGTTAPYDDLIDRYRKDEQWDDGFRLREFRYLHCVPFHIPKVCDDLSTRLRALTMGESPNFDLLLAEAAAKIDEGSDTWTTPPPALKTGIAPEEHLRQIADALDAALRLRDEALRGLPSDDVRFLQEHIVALTDRFVTDTHLSDLDEFKDRQATDKKLLDLLRHVDYGKLLLSTREMARLLAPLYLEGLRKDLLHAAEKPAKDILWSRESRHGKIVVGGTGNNLHQQPGAVLIDLGGDDFYANRAGASPSLLQPFSVIIDFAGDDRYSSYEHGCQGTGILGTGILADLEGNDTYVAQNWGQGSGLVGVGILYDKGGHDTYRGQEYLQGAGFFGVGLHVDSVGNDTYQANLYAQGFAGTKSFGLLADTAGNDVYNAAGKHRTGYGDNPGTFNGLSQGCGLGIRCYVDWTMSRSGGIGLLLDGAGDDTYEAGTFSQGGGYFFGMGMLCDFGDGSDDYLGTRYAQGFAAHSAVGYFMDEGGDDRHRALAGVHSGLSWDLTCVVFIDRDGNDTYEEGGFSRGATAHNGFIIFHDMKGNDLYLDEVGRAGGNTYHGGSSLSLFIDGGGDDKYFGDRANDTVTAEKEYSFTIDTRKSVGDLLRDDALPALIINKVK